MAKKLSKRQESMLDYIEHFIDDHAYPPTIRDIQRDLDISSTSVVDYNLNALEQRNFIRRNRNISRGIELVGRQVAAPSNLSRIPIVGQIAAGEPIPVPEDSMNFADMETIELSNEMLGSRTENLFGLRVRGMSMIDALINDGDIVILKHQETCENGETVAVWLRDEKETTLKKFYFEGDRIRLQPANAQMEPIFCDPENVEIQGKLVTVFRPYA
ncbi:MAG: transcriptional repressor LexA [Sphaerobacteraceae bacterium]|nr:MAG: transcriptional repressor LexA [Sphaerobacteraceae bacterium]